MIATLIHPEADWRWRAVLEHDAACDGRFVYAVRSTGVFCRPSCPSRRPGRSRVMFFDTPQLAERAGYRACRRCRPNQATSSTAPMDLAVRALIEGDDPAASIEDVAKRFGVSAQQLRRRFRAATGISPGQHWRAERVEKFKSHLRNGRNVTTAMFAAGYGSSSRLYEHASNQLGMTPASYQAGGKGAAIDYAVVDCCLGKLLVASTAKGVCTVKLGDASGALIRELKQEFPAASLRRTDVPVVEQIIELIEGRQLDASIPLDIRGTLFQRTVWTALCAIPRGETRSYRALAASIGKPTAARAVARACATNPVAIVVPCHRIVRATGELSGYRWGPKRKRGLLEREARERSLAQKK